MMQALTFALGILLAVSALAFDDIVVTGSFTSKAKAEEQLARVKVFYKQAIANQSSSDRAELSKARVTMTELLVQGEKHYQVSIGPFDHADIADQIQIEATKQGFKRIRTDSAQRVEPKRAKGSPSTAALSPQISEQSRVEISRFIYQAPALEEQIATLLLPVTGSQVETTTLLTTKDKINQLFVTNGFINTGMVIPDQQINEGELKLDFISGKITDLQISSRLKEKYISSRLEINEPFNLVQLQDALKLLEQNPLV